MLLCYAFNSFIIGTTKAKTYKLLRTIQIDYGIMDA